MNNIESKLPSDDQVPIISAWASVELLFIRGFIAWIVLPAGWEKILDEEKMKSFSGYLEFLGHQTVKYRFCVEHQFDFDETRALVQSKSNQKLA